MDYLYLKPNVKIEPLIWNWYAWAHLIPPATAGCNINERHIRIMNSYMQAPDVHAEAVKNPKLLGGPFIDLDSSYLEQVKQLLENTKSDCDHLIQLAASIKAFDRVLQAEAQGNTIEQLYAKIPDNLKGLIELVYDLNNYPSIRLIEPLFYHKYYKTDHQSLALSLIEDDYRPFVLSTPRLEKADEVYLKMPFNHPAIDNLFAMRQVPQQRQFIEEAFDISADKQAIFNSFFTQALPRLSDTRNYQGDQVRIRYFGHACVLLQTNNLSILLDPVISYEANSTISRYTFADLPDSIDYVLLTHNHQDHVLFETLLQLRHKIKCIIVPNNQKGALSDPSLRLILQAIGFKNIVALDDFESISLVDGEIMGMPFLGEHADLNIQTKLAYYINLKNRKFLFAADSNSQEDKLYEYSFNYVGPIDMLFLGMECDGAPLTWLYGPLLTKPLNRAYDRARQLSGSNFNRAWSLVTHSQCKQVFIYAMGQEPWLNYIMALKYAEDSPQITESNKLIAVCQENNIAAERLFGRKELLI